MKEIVNPGEKGVGLEKMRSCENHMFMTSKAS
jgi:hypothetical protein